jgi:ABC-2 type transport system permease protein
MMRRLSAVLRKELRQLFASPIAYVVTTAYVSLTGLYFFQHLVSYNRLLFVLAGPTIARPDLDTGSIPLAVNTLNEVFIPAANDFSLLLLAVLPLVTMRVFAEERSQGTDELLLTTPLRTWELALAKHLTTYLFVALLLGAASIYPAVVVVKSRLGLGHLAALLAGQLAYGVALAAIGLACSALTQSQILAAILAYAIPFVLLDFAWLEPTVSSERAVAWLRELAILGHLDGFTRGVIALRHAAYFAALAALGFGASLASLDLLRAR